jgi:hypothetical protein
MVPRSLCVYFGTGLSLVLPEQINLSSAWSRKERRIHPQLLFYTQHHHQTREAAKRLDLLSSLASSQAGV